jgi:hypothetical protein
MGAFVLSTQRPVIFTSCPKEKDGIVRENNRKNNRIIKVKN